MAPITVKDTVRRMLIQFPSLFHGKSDCFNQLFLVIGNGYDWIDGCLVDVHAEPSDEPRWSDETGEPSPGESIIPFPEIEAKIRAGRILDAKRENNQIRFVLENFDAIFAEPVRFINPYPVCEYSDLFRMPDDVQPDWKEACFEAAVALQAWLNEYRGIPIRDMRMGNRTFLQKHFAERVSFLKATKP